MMRCIYVLTNIFFFQRPHLFYFIIRNETNSLSLNHIFTKGKRKNFCVNYSCKEELINFHFGINDQKTPLRCRVVSEGVFFPYFFIFFVSFFVHEKAKKRFKKTRKSVLHSSGLGENDKKRTTGGRRPNDRTGGRKRWRARMATRTPG